MNAYVSYDMLQAEADYRAQRFQREAAAYRLARAASRDEDVSSPRRGVAGLWQRFVLRGSLTSRAA